MKFSIITTWLASAAVLQAADSNNPPAASAQIEHGKYLVERVGMCGDCHSPRNDKGEFDRAQWLQGSILAFQPLVKMPWSADAPAIAGLPGYTDEKAMTLLTTGRLPSGEALRPPMPAYRLNESEAKAVVAYLRSLAKS